MIVLGINGLDNIFHDSSATLVVEGKIAAFVEEERFNRQKHSNGLPFNAIEFCMRKGGVSFSEIDHIGYYLDPALWIKARYTDLLDKYKRVPRAIEQLAMSTACSIREVENRLHERFPIGRKPAFHFLNHHLAHAASAFYISGFESSAVLVIDGAGERESSTLYTGGPRGLEKIHDLLIFPESLGLVYSFMAAHLGLGWISGPGKLMGLAGYGTPDEELFADIIIHRDDPCRPVQIDTSFFDFFRLSTTWARWSRMQSHSSDKGAPSDSASDERGFPGGGGFSNKAILRFGPPVAPGEPLTQHHCDLAASVQNALEHAVVHITRQIPMLLPGESNLCLAGGVFLNVRANRRIRDMAEVDRLFVTPPAYDGGTSLGCALHLDSVFSRRQQYEFDVYSGPHIEEDFDIEAACRLFGDLITWRELTEDRLIRSAASCLVANQIIGWVQGRMECGPRALGNRSILANAMVPDMKDALNSRVKKRESFRPYAPSVLREECANWFDLEDSPFMLLEATVHPDMRHRVPGVVHVDGTSRPQTVTEESNPRYYRLIRTFYECTGIPLIMNTSFNRHGEPMVNSPKEAITVLLESEMDELFVGRYQIRNKLRSQEFAPVSIHRWS